MTQPTPAQIEAFRQVMPSWWHRGYAQKKEETEEIVRCLTAAAEVGHTEEDEIEDALKASLGDAAADVGGGPWKSEAVALAEANAIAATIERCAQVADRYAVGYGRPAREIAAEIRALKDK